MPRRSWPHGATASGSLGVCPPKGPWPDQADRL